MKNENESRGRAVISPANPGAHLISALEKLEPQTIVAAVGKTAGEILSLHASGSAEWEEIVKKYAHYLNTQRTIQRWHQYGELSEPPKPSLATRIRRRIQQLLSD